ncbi:hypothetical protein K8T06_05725 [bacterium]|nr:hypothetical protein [bacterium]
MKYTLLLMVISETYHSKFGWSELGGGFRVMQSMVFWQTLCYRDSLAKKTEWWANK